MSNKRRAFCKAKEVKKWIVMLGMACYVIAQFPAPPVHAAETDLTHACEENCEEHSVPEPISC